MYAEDFAQTFLLWVCEGKKPRVHTGFIDFLRKYINDKRFKYGHERIGERMKWLDIEGIHAPPSLDNSPEDDYEDKHRFDWILKERDRHVCIMYGQFGMTLLEIAKGLGVSESRIHQIVRQYGLN